MKKTNLVQLFNGVLAVLLPFSVSAQDSKTLAPISQEEAKELQKAVAEFSALQKKPGLEMKSFSKYLRSSRGLNDTSIDRILADKVNLQSLKDYAKSIQSEPFKS